MGRVDTEGLQFSRVYDIVPLLLQMVDLGLGKGLGGKEELGVAFCNDCP